MTSLLHPLLLALGAATPAHAWTHNHRVWLPEDFPLEYWVADDGSSPNTPARCEASGGLEGCGEETVPSGYGTQAAAEGFEAWRDAPCAEFGVEYQGVSPNINWNEDNRFYISFNDPNPAQIEEGTLAVTFSTAGEFAFNLDGQRYNRFDDVDIVFNDEVVFTTHEDAISSTCSEAFDMRSVITHEIGHSLGMDHSCEDLNKGGLPCTDPIKREATMYYSVDTCQGGAADINEDDIEGFTALYGPFATFQCSHELQDGLAVGIVPFDLKCVIVSDYLSEITSADWNFGDGGTANTLAATHTYTEPGNYTIQVTVNGDRESCGEEGWQNNYRRVGYVRACGVPDAAFVVEHIDGLQYKMLNESDVSVYGCIDNIGWQVFEGDNTAGEPIIDQISAWEPSFDLPEPGTYTIVMNLGGIAGTGAASVTFEAKDRRGEGQGCGCAHGHIGLAANAWMLLAASFMRRR